MTSAHEIAADLATRLGEAAAHGRPIAPVRDELSGCANALDLAYTVQALGLHARIAAGARRVGRKIGLTSPAVQAQLGVSHPDFGSLLDDMALGDGETAPAHLLQPRAEAEMALVLARDLDQERPTIADVISATDYVVAAIEVCASRVAEWRIGLLDTVADNASAGAFVLGGAPRSLRQVDPRALRMRLLRGGEVVSEGVGTACLGNPMTAATWLAREMARRGDPLRAGEIVLTGALGPMVPCRPGDWFEALIDGLGAVAFSMAAHG